MVLALSVAACGSDSSGGGGSSDDPITIGFLGPLTGASAQTAEQAKNAAEIRVAQINADGGVDGRDLELKVYDSKLDPAVATQQAQRAISQDKVEALIGPLTSTEVLAAGELAERLKTVLITYSAATEAITEGKEYIFRTSPLTGDLSTAMMRLGQRSGAATGALLYDNSSFGLGAKGPVEAAAETEGFQLLDSVEYPVGASDVSAQVAAIVKQKPAAVFIAGAAGADYGLIGKAMVEQGLLVPLIGFSPIVSADALKIGESAYSKLPGVYTIGCVDFTKSAYTELVDAYNKDYSPVEVLPEQALQAVDAINWLAESFGKTSGKGGEDLVKALTSLPAVESVGGRSGAEQQFTSDDHDAYGDAYIVPYKVVDGKLAPADIDID
ncbi:MAG: ABC transporter substrate-binding protein [Nocardioides sp.]|uniref:ABC transporter substrate-binding protein n=1 Tax=Nocardioides sp. TaxID=35761 RepID=UPI0032674833